MCVENHAIPVRRRLKLDARVEGEFVQVVLVVHGDVVFDSLQGERTVHSAGLNVEVFVAPSELGGEGALPCPSRAVYGDDDSAISHCGGTFLACLMSISSVRGAAACVPVSSARAF